jgi:hypothetical protein
MGATGVMHFSRYPNELTLDIHLISEDENASRILSVQPSENTFFTGFCVEKSFRKRKVVS